MDAKISFKRIHSPDNEPVLEWEPEHVIRMNGFECEFNRLDRQKGNKTSVSFSYLHYMSSEVPFKLSSKAFISSTGGVK